MNLELAVDRNEGRVVFEVISPTGNREQITSMSELDAVPWLH